MGLRTCPMRSASQSYAHITNPHSISLSYTSLTARAKLSNKVDVQSMSTVPFPSSLPFPPLAFPVAQPRPFQENLRSGGKGDERRGARYFRGGRSRARWRLNAHPQGKTRMPMRVSMTRCYFVDRPISRPVIDFQ